MGLDPAWLTDMQQLLPPPTLTILLDIAPETAVKRKAVDRDRYERDLALQARVRESYHRQAAESGWVVLDGERSTDAIAADAYGSGVLKTPVAPAFQASVGSPGSRLRATARPRLAPREWKPPAPLSAPAPPTPRLLQHARRLRASLRSVLTSSMSTTGRA